MSQRIAMVIAAKNRMSKEINISLLQIHLLKRGFFWLDFKGITSRAKLIEII